ncbi:MAG: bifunctional phosphoribosylaminoimidazolecarboxamide formyltransferase/IMP cyclohydrolase [Burkholderiaceae bacterium]
MASATRRALISVSDKTDVVPFARRLAAAGFEILSTGGTASALSTAGVAVTEVSDYTGFPEMLDGRVKTLHPKVHGGLLARRDSAAHQEAARAAGIAMIDVLAVNLYPFTQTGARPDCRFDEAIENIDIGGPAMLRAAAKNHDGVAVVVDPSDYEAVAAQIEATGAVDATTRRTLAAKVFAHTARYDGAISDYLSGLAGDPPADAAPAREPFPRRITLQYERVQALRYGENPHQAAAFYRGLEAVPGAFASYRQLQGKELSYNNIADADAAWECVKRFAEPACVIVKHANPCGVGRADEPVAAYRRAFATDPTSAFGGIIAFNRPVDEKSAVALGGQFVAVVIAPDYERAALERFAAKANIRVLRIELPAAAAAAAAGAAGPAGARYDPARNDLKRVGGGLLVQTPDDVRLAATDLKVVTRRQPDPQQVADLLFAWDVATFVKSNAIVFCRDGQTLGVGAGQMSRVDSSRIAALKAAAAGLDLAGSVAASDAFFPFRDGLDSLVDAGAVAVIQPGGSMRDDEVIAAADEREIAMVFTGVRHFRH